MKNWLDYSHLLLLLLIFLHLLFFVFIFSSFVVTYPHFIVMQIRTKVMINDKILVIFFFFFFSFVFFFTQLHSLTLFYYFVTHHFFIFYPKIIIKYCRLNLKIFLIFKFHFTEWNNKFQGAATSQLFLISPHSNIH